MKGKYLSEEETSEFIHSMTDLLCDTFVETLHKKWGGKAVAPSVICKIIFRFSYATVAMVSDDSTASAEADNAAARTILRKNMILDLISNLTEQELHGSECEECSRQH